MEKAKTVELCGKCAELMRETYQLRRVAGGVNNKITCGRCGRRRYGAAYMLGKQSKSVPTA